MFGSRKARPEDASASFGQGGATSNAKAYAIPTPGTHVEMMEERLQRLNDEETWQQSHTQLVINYNKTSLAFWLLCSASLCFALLNGYHGFSSSGAAIAGGAALIIGFLYFTIELTVPVSAHLMSWGAKGQARWAVRIIGIIAYSLGVAFSLLILQGKFSSGADTASARAEAQATVYSSDRDQLETARATVASLKGRVGGKNPAGIEGEMEVILSQTITQRDNLRSTTLSCTGQRKTSKERELCAQYDTLKRLHGDAVAYAAAQADVLRLTGNMTDVSRTSVRSADVQDKVIANLLGMKLENIQLFKASFIALMAALLTHLLWAAHGHTVNLSIARKRDEVFEKNALQRALDRENAKKAAEEAAQVAAARRTAEETTAAFMAAQGTHQKVASAIATAPLKEQPVVVQLQRYFTERSIMGPDFTMQVGIFHDDYAMWARNQGLTPVTVDRFVSIVKDVGLGVSADGRIVGAAIRSGA